MHLLVGLGNPGERYRHTRHNLGWDVVVAIARGWSLASIGNRFRGRFGDGRVGGERVFWLLPETYMNLSGHSVAEAMRFYKLGPDQVIVFHDDLDLALGKVRIKQGGGHAGHNGLRSIQQELGSAEFVRVRLGIGRPPAGRDPSDYVLQPFVAEEGKVVDDLVAALPGVVPLLLAGDLAGAMNKLANPGR